MAKKKAAKKQPAYEREDSFLQDIRSKLPFLYDKAASLQPFDDVINEQWCQTAHFGIVIDVDARVCPSGCYSTYGAEIHADHVMLFTRLHATDGDVFYEEYRTDMAGLWSFLRQLPRPIHSFGKWTGGE